MPLLQKILIVNFIHNFRTPLKLLIFNLLRSLLPHLQLGHIWKNFYELSPFFRNTFLLILRPCSSRRSPTMCCSRKSLRWVSWNEKCGTCLWFRSINLLLQIGSKKCMQCLMSVDEEHISRLAESHCRFEDVSQDVDSVRWVLSLW